MRNRRGKRKTMANGPDENTSRAPGKKSWLSGTGAGIAASAFIGLMGSMVFLTRGMYAFQQGADDVGIGYMVLTAAFPVGMIIGAWWMERGTDPMEGESEAETD